jgi:ferredoxin-like protein FixX
MWMLGGKIFTDRLPIHGDAESMKKASGDSHGHHDFKPDGKTTYDKLTGVYQAGSVHDEHQPSHLKIADTSLCAGKCASEYGNPCERFCPASVYEMVDVPGGGRKMQINFSNCVHWQNVRHPRPLSGHHVDGAAGFGRPQVLGPLRPRRPRLNPGIKELRESP